MSKISLRRKQPMSETRENRRSAILKAACIEFCENGFECTKMEQIAKRAGIGKSTVYEYFSSKNELLQASCDWIFKNIQHDVEKIMQSETPFKQKVRDYIDYICNLLTSIGNGISVFYSSSDSTQQIIRNIVYSFHTMLCQTIQTAAEQAMQNGEIRNDISPKSIAKIITFTPSPIFCEEIKNDKENILDDILNLLYSGFCKQNKRI